MFKVLKNLKESWIWVIVIVLFLCLQAAVDLALPDYTSRIVNNGIQAGGITSAVPDVISKEDMDHMLLLTKADDDILNHYQLIEEGTNLSKEQEKIVKTYFGKETKTDIYVVNELEEEQRDALSKTMANVLMTYSAVTNEETSEAIKAQILANVPEPQKEMMKNGSLVSLIQNMPEEQREALLEESTKQMDGMQDSIKEQAAIASVKQLYQNLEIDTDKIQNDYIWLAGLQMLGIAAISMVSAVVVMMLSARVAAKLGKTLREKVFRKVTNFSNKELSEFSTASLITRSTNDISQVQQLISMLFRVVVYAPIIGIGGVIKVLTTTDSQMAWIIALAIGGILLVVGTLFIIAMPRFKKLQELTDKLNLVSREILTGLQVIRAFHKEEKEEKRFEVANNDLKKVNVFVNRAMSMMMPMLMLIMNAIMILIIWVGGHNVDQGTMQVGDMMAFIQYTMQIVMAFLMISMISIMLPRAGVSAKRITEVLDAEPDIKDKEETKELDKTKKGLVEFRNVCFRYPDADTEILEDINFTAKPGETTAIIGSTGSGKSTIVNLLPRFYDVTNGTLLIDGVNVKDMKQKDLRDIIGFVPQKGILFSGTIESNIKYADENISDEKMYEAARIAQATDFIEAKEKKYQAEISQGGTNVSGGQRQRLSIARAIAKDPEIFVFDDSFSALDLKTDSKLREALSETTKDKTVIIVAQRISTIMTAEKIVVLDEGKVVGIGTHEELLENCETYKEIALSQLSEEELNDNKKGGNA